MDTVLSSPCQPSSSPSSFLPPPQAWCSLLLKASLLIENYQSMNYLQLGLFKNATSVTFRGSTSLNLSIGPQICRKSVYFWTVFWASTITGIFFSLSTQNADPNKAFMLNSAHRWLPAGLKWQDLQRQFSSQSRFQKEKQNKVRTSAHPREAAEHSRQREKSMRKSSQTINKSLTLMAHNSKLVFRAWRLGYNLCLLYRPPGLQGNTVLVHS